MVKPNIDSNTGSAFQVKYSIELFLSYGQRMLIKTGIFVSLAAYWGVILVGTFITFN